MSNKLTPSPRPSPSKRSPSRSGASTPVPAVLTGPPTTLHSEASSVINFDLSSDGILVQDTDPQENEIEESSVNASGHVQSAAGDEESKKTLRDQLRRTLSRKTSNQGSGFTQRSTSYAGKNVAINEVPGPAESSHPPRDYFVLTNAGKPVFIRSESESVNSETTTNIVGIIQALISVFLDDNDDKIRCINSGRTRITFLLRPPLYYACVSKWGEPESVTRSHLEYLHLQILSIVTASQLKRFFERRTNFDLGRLLSGADSFLTTLLDRLEFDLAISMSALHCLKIEPSLRKKAAEALVPQKIKDILYVLIVARDRVVCLVRPKKHSVHPADVHIILNTIHAPSIINSSAAGSWIPICLPKFNSGAFVNAYVSYLRKDSDRNGGELGNEGGPPTLDPNKNDKNRDIDLALVCISGGQQNFDATRVWCESVVQKLESEGILDQITYSVLGGPRPSPAPRTFSSPHTPIASSSSSVTQASVTPAPPLVHRATSVHPSRRSSPSPSGSACKSEYSVSDLSIPGLRHFVYKSRSMVQVTHPVFEDLYEDLEEKRRLVTLYQILHDNIHAKSGQEGGLKLQYIKTDKEAVMGWITQPFEVYITISPLLPKTAAVNAANAVARWVKKEEGRLFLKDAPVF